MSQLQQESQIFVKTIPSRSWGDVPDRALTSIDLWKIYIPAHLQIIDQLSALLSPDEKSRVTRYHQQKDKNRFVIGRGMLRQILSYYTGCSPRELQFAKGINNKPSIQPAFPIEFNLSYSQEFIVVGIASQPIGADIEFIHPDFDYSLLLDACFMAPEIKVIVDAADPRQEFFLFWTRKEALLKATALGLGDYLTDFSCLEGAQPIPKFLPTEGDWQLESFLLEERYWISLAKNFPAPHQYIDAKILFKHGS